jgi:hypothetical protein
MTFLTNTGTRRNGLRMKELFDLLNLFAIEHVYLRRVAAKSAAGKW